MENNKTVASIRNLFFSNNKKYIGKTSRIQTFCSSAPYSFLLFVVGLLYVQRVIAQIAEEKSKGHATLSSFLFIGKEKALPEIHSAGVC